MSQESKTPRTDAEAAEAAKYASISKGWYVHASFARQLESELAAVTEERDALIASARIKEANSGWRPIETAPRDGRLFLCWVSAVRYGETDEGQQCQQDVSQVDFCNWRTQPYHPDCGWFDPCCGQIGDQQGVTHWMPLPAPPTTEPGQ